MKSTKAALACLLLLVSPVAPADNDENANSNWNWGVRGGAGYFNFRNSLFVDIDPDPPGNLSDNWAEIFIKPWLRFSRRTGHGEWFGEASWAYARTDDAAAEISGGAGDSADFDALYLGWRSVASEKGQFEVVGGRYDYQLAKGLLIADGYADGGSRGAIWSNPRTAWAPGGLIRHAVQGHVVEAFYLDRDERPESDSKTNIRGLNYQWSTQDQVWVIGVSYLRTVANELRQALDGADMWNLRLYRESDAHPWAVEAEWAHQDNGLQLDANAWYLQTSWHWRDTPWRPKLYYRYAYFQGDKPETPTNEDFEPMFPAFYDWGSWWQGEIAGEYFLSNSNIRTQMLRLHTTPRDNIGAGLILFDYRLDQPGSFQGGVDSGDFAKEINWYMDWEVSRLFRFSFVLARNDPGRAIEEAFNRTKAFRYAMIYLSFSTE